MTHVLHRGDDVDSIEAMSVKAVWRMLGLDIFQNFGLLLL